MEKTFKEYVAELQSVGSVLNPTKKPQGTMGTSSTLTPQEQEDNEEISAEITNDEGNLEPDVPVIVPNADGTANNAVVQQDMGDRVNIKRDDGTTDIVDKEELMLLQQELEQMKRRAGI